MTLPFRISTVTLLFLAPLLMLPLQASTANSNGGGAREQSPRIIVAKVNGRPIFQYQIEARIQKSTHKDNRLTPPATSKGSPVIKKALQEQALNEQIAAELFYQAGQQLNIPDAKNKIAAEIAKRKATRIANQQQVDDDALKTYVQRHFYITEYMAAKDLITPKVTEAELSAYYEETKQGYASETDAVHVRHILIKADKSSSAEEQKQAHKKIQQVQQHILAGMSFIEAAKKYSQDANASAGGDLGHIKPGYMPPEFEKLAFSLTPGQISPIIKTKFGYHLLKTLGIKPKGSLPKYEDVKDFFEKYLSNRLLEKRVPAHVQYLKENAKIEVYPFQ